MIFLYPYFRVFSAGRYLTISLILSLLIDLYLLVVNSYATGYAILLVCIVIIWLLVWSCAVAPSPQTYNDQGQLPECVRLYAQKFDPVFWQNMLDAEYIEALKCYLKYVHKYQTMNQYEHRISSMQAYWIEVMAIKYAFHRNQLVKLLRLTTTSFTSNDDWLSALDKARESGESHNRKLLEEIIQAIIEHMATSHTRQSTSLN